MVTKKELADWAREFASVVKVAKEQKQSVKLPDMIRQSAHSHPSGELRAALLDIADGQETQTRGVFAGMRAYPEIFDNWFVHVMGYGFFYNELDKVLFRFADRPEELGIDYFGPTAGRCDAPVKSSSKPA